MGERLTPWSWTIESRDQARFSCPSAAAMLGTYAAVNGVVSALGIVLGNRRFIEWATRGYLGEPNSRSYRRLWPLPVGLQLAANAINAALVKKSAGYVATFSVGEYMLFLTARPRLSVVVLGALSRYGDGDDYWSSFMSNAIAEVVLQCLAAYTMGRTATLADDRGYYQFQSSFSYMGTHVAGRPGYIHPRPSLPPPDESRFDKKADLSLSPGARLFYCGAIFYLLSGVVFIPVAAAFLYYMSGKGTHHQDLRRAGRAVFFLLLLLLATTWSSSWVFWAGFVKMAGNKYCLPNLAGQGAVWGSMSLLGITLGGGP